MRLEWKLANEEMAKWANKMVKNARKAIRYWQKLIMSCVILSYTGKPRVKHLALHARKARTRKKNYHRILKENRRNR